MMSLVGLLMLVCGSALLGSLLGSLIGDSLTRRDSPRGETPEASSPDLDKTTADDIDLAAGLWAAEHDFPEARGIVADKLRLLARLRRDWSTR